MRYRVLHVHALPVVSGSGINTFITMRDVDPGRFDSELACAPGGALEDLVRSSGLTFHPFPNFVQPVEPVNDLAALVRLTAFLLKSKFHIVHTHNSKTGFIGRLAGRLARVPVVIHTVHGFSFHDAEGRLRRRLFRCLERIAARWSDRMIFISQPLIDWALREKIVRQSDRFVKIYSGIEVEKFPPAEAAEKGKNRRKWGISKEAFVVGIVSKLWEGKGHRVLIDAVSILRDRVPEVRLVILGEGPLRPDLEAQVRRLGLDKAVVFAGFHSEVAPIISMFDVSVLPSFFEGMGRVLLEAMAMGIPVVGSNVGGIPDLICHGREGLLVPAGDRAALADAILQIRQDRKTARKMGRAGMRRVTEAFSAGKMVRDIESVYLDALTEKGFSHYRGRS